MSDNLPDSHSGSDRTMVLPRPDDAPTTVIVASRTVDGTYEVPDESAIEDRTAPPDEPEAEQPEQGRTRRIRQPRMWWDHNDQPAAPQAVPNPVPEQPEPEPVPDEEPASEPQLVQREPFDPHAWASAVADQLGHHYRQHFHEESGWNRPRIRWAWRWIAPAGAGWATYAMHATTGVLTWFHGDGTQFWIGAFLVAGCGWVVYRTRRQRPVIAWLTRVPLATVTAAWLALPVTSPALGYYATLTLHTAAGVLNTLTAHR